MTALYSVPAWLLLVVAMLGAAAIACGMLLAIRRSFPRVDFSVHNGVIGTFSGIVGSLFTVTVAFIIAIVWQEYDTTRQRVATEVAAAKDLWHVSVGFPAPMERRVQGALMQYGRLMVDEEWPLMRSGQDSRRAEIMFAATYEDVIRFRPATPGEGTVQATALQDFATIRGARQNRLDDNRRGITPFEWTTLLLGSLAVIGLCCMVGLPNLRAHFVLTAAVAAMIAATFVLIFELDYPFRGDVAVPADLWRGFVADHR